MKSIRLMAAALITLSMVACASAEQMAKMANNVKVNCDPAVLEAVAGTVDANLTVTYPEKYFNPKAILTVTPVVVYDGGETKLAPIIYQGEKVKDNYKTVSSKGQTVRERISFDFVEGMEVSSLELRGVASLKGKSVNLPVRKVADGINTTYMLVDQNGFISYKPDNYQDVIHQTAEGQIKYAVNSSEVTNKQINSQSIKDFQNAVESIKKDERSTITGTKVIAYASPEGGQKLNSKLSQRRSETADKAWDKVMKNSNLSDPEVLSMGQDWEGFQELVAQSDIEDKDLILRVLNMYSDPEVRENEIRNMSQVFLNLKKGILPELRRARFIADVEYKNYTSEELLQLIDNNIDVLDEDALLHAATLVQGFSKKKDLYEKAIDKFDSDRARFNLGVANLEAGQLSAAKRAFNSVKTQDADIENALGIIDMQAGNYDDALRHFKKAGDENATANRGVLDILQGNYSAAADELKNAPGCCYNKTLAYILNNDLNKAKASAQCESARVAYLKAIIAARQGDAQTVASELAKASKVPELARRAKTDIEFAQYR